MSDQTAVATASATEVAKEFAEAYNASNYDRCAELMTDDVVEREINPRGYVEFHGREAIIEEARDFLARSEALEVLELTVEPAGPLVRVINRWKVVREGRPHLCDFYELLRIEGGRVAQIDLVCSGVMPDETATRPDPRTLQPLQPGGLAPSGRSRSSFRALRRRTRRRAARRSAEPGDGHDGRDQPDAAD